MQKNILWTGREYYSLENCLINTAATGVEITSALVGLYQGKLYRVEYSIQTSAKWETTSVEIKCQHNNSRQLIKLHREDNASWLLDGKKNPVFDGCADVDIPVTPFTNSLPINRLRLVVGSEQIVPVIYIDVLSGDVKPVRQKYIRTAENAYHYENIPNDFEADIVVDQSGFVVDYPELFVRTFAEETRYK